MSGERAALETIWSVAALRAAETPAVAALPVRVQTAEGDVLAGVGIDGSRYVLFPVAPGTVVEEDILSEGVRLTGRPLVHAGVTRTFAALSCAKPWLQDAFGEIAEECISRLVNEGDRADRLVHRVLEEWRELLARKSREGLSDEAILGLIGEMDTLVELAGRNPGGATRAWTGPAGGLHDFRNGEIALEVKTTGKRHRRSLTINGVDQLRAPEGAELFLRLVRVERVPGGTVTLRGLATRLFELGVTGPELDRRLAEMGLHTHELGAYDHVAVDVAERLAYRVDEQFPRLTPESFRDGRLPAGVVTITYSVELTGGQPEPLSIPEFDHVCEELVR